MKRPAGPSTSGPAVLLSVASGSENWLSFEDWAEEEGGCSQHPGHLVSWISNTWWAPCSINLHSSLQLSPTCHPALHPLHHHPTWLLTARCPPALSYFGFNSLYVYQARLFLGTSSCSQLAHGEQLSPSFSWFWCPVPVPSLSPHAECPRLHLPSLAVFDAFLHPPHSRSDISAFGPASLSPLFLALSWLEEH